VIVFGHQLDNDAGVLWSSDNGASWEAIISEIGDQVVRDAAFDKPKAVFFSGCRSGSEIG
jgi:hypothetical protein